MKAWLIVSELTFVPDNYDQFLKELATDPRVIGCTVILNNSWSFKLKAFILLCTGFAYRLGLQLLKNSHPSSLDRKKKIFSDVNKPLLLTKDPHDNETLSVLENSKIDLIINARTRTLFKQKLLSLPAKGCLNIHHGLLPDQRGLMCDFWGLYHDQDSGFSIHEMTTKLDSGNIFWTQVTPPHPLGYLEQVASSAKEEANAIKSVLELIENESFAGIKNTRGKETVYYKNPKLSDFLKFFLRGKRL